MNKAATYRKECDILSFWNQYVIRGAFRQSEADGLPSYPFWLCIISSYELSPKKADASGYYLYWSGQFRNVSYFVFQIGQTVKLKQPFHYIWLKVFPVQNV